MPVAVTCPKCKKKFPVERETLHQGVACPDCKVRISLKSAKETAAGQAASALTTTGIQAAPPSSSTSSSLPAKIGRFEVRARLGAGAFGQVYHAFDPVLKREVALKVPREKLDPKEEDRFVREAMAAAKLFHPNIVPIFDTGKEDGNCFIAFRYVKGKTLQDELEPAKEQGMDFRRAAEVVRQLAEALAHAHAQKVVHRDVKPANILVDAEGKPNLTDFGLAVLQEGAAKITHASAGTAAYMSPEQARGQEEKIGPASDQYSLGVVLYELLTGDVPFHGTPAIVAALHANQDPPPPRRTGAAIPRDLETICLKGMAKVPEDRYADCQEMGDDLRRWLEGEAIRARRMGFLERGWRWCKRQPVLATMIGLVSASLIGLAILFGFLAESKQETQALEKTRVEEAQKFSAESYLERGLGLCERGRVDEGLLFFSRALEKTPERFENLHLVIREKVAMCSTQVLLLRQTFRLPGPIKSIDAVSKLFAVTNVDPTSHHLQGHVINPMLNQIVSGPFECVPPKQLGFLSQPFQLSPDRRYVAVTSTNTVQIRHISDDHGLVKEVATRYLRSMTFSPNGKYLAIHGSDVSILETANGNGIFELKGPSKDNTIWSLAFNPQSQSELVLMLETTGKVRGHWVEIWDVSSNKLKKRFSIGESMRTGKLAFFPKSILCIASPGTLSFYDMESSLEKTVDLKGGVPLFLEPFQSSLFFTSHSEFVTKWMVVPANTSLSKQIECMPEFNPFTKIVGYKVLGVDPLFALLTDRKTEREIALLYWGRAVTSSSHAGKITAAAVFTPFIATGDENGEVRLWQVPFFFQKRKMTKGAVEQVALWIEIITGKQVDEHDQVQFLTHDALQVRRGRLAELGGDPSFE